MYNLFYIYNFYKNCFNLQLFYILHDFKALHNVSIKNYFYLIILNFVY